ncbi:MAG TPA: peptidoglycan DD-metalloendopeptidase family protein [Gammaproteobacteria bacterium]|nr:peptidoglycan DD-metalloendopeptidase family protein [Gammaproteobacteria bacterium]
MRGWYIGLAIAGLLLSACGSLVYHRVREGETLYSIGWEYGYDYRTLAQWNDIAPPYVIKPGDWVRIAPPGTGMAAAGNGEGHSPAQSRSGAPPPHDRSPPRAASAKPPAAHSGSASRTIHWTWPAKGKLLMRFSSHHLMQKGLDIAGTLGEPVVAAAAGRVVYSGNGLKGYGNLVIIKHGQHYLSAYGYNSRLFVKEGDLVSRGQEIAAMGRAGTDRVKLHFEIRRDGDPVNPLDYLPFGHSLE